MRLELLGVSWRSIIDKFYDIVFPLFALKKEPYELVFDHNTIKIRRTRDSHLETVDDKKLQGDYFARLIQMPKRLKFDYTCRNIQDCIYSKIVWGVDKKAKIHHLDFKEPYPARWMPIERTKNNLIWIKGISYPYELNTKENLQITEKTYARVVKYYNEWYLYGFSTEPNDVNKYELI